LLEDSYLVTEDPTDNRYYIGPLITRLTTNPAVLHEYLVRCAFEEMKHLSNLTEETVSLDILLGIQAIPVYEIVSPHEIRVTDNSKRLGLVCTGASGKVLLSQFNDERLKVAMKYIVIPKATENTVTDKNILVSQLMDIRQKGYAVSFGERIPGALCISAPIHNYTSPAVMSIIGPEYRFRARLETVVQELKTCASRVSRNVLDIFSSP
jgi:DNA-binding IclR family transcriptional regulator